MGRDVSLNLRIVTERTAALGIDGHICELQLILHSFAKLKVPPCWPSVRVQGGIL
jgi:hypothetical protein